MWDSIWINTNLATFSNENEFGAVSYAAIASKDGIISYVGPMADLPDAPNKCASDVYDLAGQWVLPGLIDCHTHLVYAGNRADEFAMRLKGATYEEIANITGLSITNVATRLSRIRQKLRSKMLNPSK